MHIHDITITIINIKKLESTILHYYLIHRLTNYCNVLYNKGRNSPGSESITTVGPVFYDVGVAEEQASCCSLSLNVGFLMLQPVFSKQISDAVSFPLHCTRRHSLATPVSSWQCFSFIQYYEHRIMTTCHIQRPSGLVHRPPPQFYSERVRGREREWALHPWSFVSAVHSVLMGCWGSNQALCTARHVCWVSEVKPPFQSVSFGHLVTMTNSRLFYSEVITSPLGLKYLVGKYFPTIF